MVKPSWKRARPTSRRRSTIGPNSPARRTPIGVDEYPALQAYWRRRNKEQYDDLWVMACWEASAREFREQGNEDMAKHCERKARDVAKQKLQ